MGVEPVAVVQYGPFDRERIWPEAHSSSRGDFQRDRGRIIHSSGFRRLAQKTQVLSPTAGVDFARNRLTHSLEVAQVGREVGQSLGLDPDVVDAACLAHDLGHPPFGHNGELALAAWAKDIGGFEGNAQTLRVLSRLEPKVVSDQGESRGLNLTRASLDAATKYPWFLNQVKPGANERAKFGVYREDEEVFAWLREGIPQAWVSIEAQVMDFSDDVAYSVHDFEDAIVGGFLHTSALSDQAWVERLVGAGASWSGEGIEGDDVLTAYRRLREWGSWPEKFEGTRADYAGLKNLTSSLIGRFANSVTVAERPESAGAPWRYHTLLEVAPSTKAEILLLKAIVASAVMGHETRQPLYAEQRQVLRELLDVIAQDPPAHLEPQFLQDFEAAPDEAAKRRVIVDQVASLTDQSATLWHERLVAGG